MDLLPLVMALGTLTVAVVLHEVGHGVVAYRCGDATAAEQGRLTLNPLRHIDPIGTVVLPIGVLVLAWAFGAHPTLFGWAKPVPIDARRLGRPRRDMALVALAGPTVNFLLAGLGAFGLRMGHEMDGLTGALVRVTAGATIGTNCVLGVLNLLPILPLDGGRVLASLLPLRLARSYARLERVGLVVVVLLLSQTSILSTLVGPVLRSFLSLAAGTR